jgi:ketosteroid isomerase-like protein
MNAFSWVAKDDVDEGPLLGPPRPGPPARPKQEPPGSHPNAKRVRESHAALERRDFQAAFKDFTESFKLEVPAQLPFDPGEVRGPIVVLGLVRKMLELTGGQFRTELLSVTAVDDLAVSLHRVTVTRRGKSRVYHSAWVYRIVGDKIVEGTLHVSLSPADLREVFS